MDTRCHARAARLRQSLCDSSLSPTRRQFVGPDRALGQCGGFRDIFWRSITKDNITSWYGKTAESRIADPADPARVFSWLICESYDGKGNVVSYEYKAEDSEGVDLSQVNERNRTGTTRSVNRYIKRVFYGNRTPYFPDLTAAAEVQLPSDWCFELVFDYGYDDPPPRHPRRSTASRCTCRRRSS